MSKGTRIELPEGELNKLKSLLRGKEKQINEAANTGLNRVATSVLKDAQENLTKNKSVATNKLRSSGFIRPQQDLSIDVTFETNYAASVEFGQPAGTKVSVKALVEWLKKKGFYALGARGGRAKKGAKFTNSIWAVATKISQNIMEKGTKAKPFLFPAFRKNEANMMRVIDDAIKKVL